MKDLHWTTVFECLLHIEVYREHSTPALKLILPIVIHTLMNCVFSAYNIHISWLENS